MSTTTVLVVRHAAPVLPVVGTLPETDGDRDLTPAGRRAATDLAEQLCGEGITAIYSSPARRAIATVEPLAEVLGFDIRLHDDLVERWLADRVLPDDGWLEAFRKTWLELGFRPDGGESRRATLARALRAFDDIAARHAGETVVASTHGGLIACMLRSFDDSMTFEDALAIPMPAVFAFERNDGSWRLADRYPPGG